MTPHAKEIPNESVHGQESLSVSGGFEPPHLSLALAGRLMRDFGSIVLVLLRAVHDGRHHEAVGRRVAAKLVRESDAVAHGPAFSTASGRSVRRHPGRAWAGRGCRSRRHL